mgnify:CR=1 FL=1
MANNDIFDNKKIIALLRAQGVSDKEIEKLYGPLPKPEPDKKPRIPNSKRVRAHQRDNAWKYDNKHEREWLQEDLDPDYEPIEELRKKPDASKKKPIKPRISRKKPKPKPKRFNWDKVSEERLKNLYEAGYTIKEIANELKLTEDAISGKITRMRNSGWKGQVGTTHNPLPQPSPGKAPKAPKNLSPDAKKFLANVLQKNFGVVGTYFSKRWGLISPSKKDGLESGDLTGAVIKSNQLILQSITKLDTTLRRGTTTLTKVLAQSTSKMVDAINATTDLVRKNQQNIEQVTPTSQAAPGKIGSGSGGAGAIAALLGGGALAMLLSSRSEAAVNPLENITEFDGPESTEDQLRTEGEIQNNIEPNDIEYNVKELIFEADKIEFEADEFKFKTKNGFGGGQITPTPKTGVAPGASPTSSGGNGNAPSSGGFFNNLLDKIRGGPGSAGMFNRWADKLFGTGGSDGKGNLPSDKEMADKDSKWWQGKSGASPKSGAGVGDSGQGGGTSETLAQQRERYKAEMANNPELREQIKAMASAEDAGSDDAPLRAVMETMMNRASAYNKSLADIVGNRDYYEPYQNGSYLRHLNRVRNDPEYSKRLDKILDQVIGGSNQSNYATHNGSAGVRESAKRTQTTGWDAPNGEIFTRKDRPEFSHIHGAGTTAKEGDWYKRTKDADDFAAALKKLGHERLREMQSDTTGGKAVGDDASGNAPLKRIYIDGSSSGSQLNEEQKQSDTDAIKDTQPSSDKRSDRSLDNRSDDIPNDTTQTALLETEGPNHFSDFPMSDQGTGA